MAESLRVSVVTENDDAEISVRIEVQIAQRVVEFEQQRPRLLRGAHMHHGVAGGDMSDKDGLIAGAGMLARRRPTSALYSCRLQRGRARLLAQPGGS